MARIVGWVVPCVLAWAVPAAAQEEGAFERVPLRVVSSGPDGGAVVVDRGQADGMQAGDLVLLQPRDGGDYWATVARTEERTAVIEMHNKNYFPAPGVRGVLLIPRTRLAGLEEEPATAAGSGAEGAAEPHPPWRNKDDVWSPGEPLLARVKPLRPEERSLMVTGRVYAGLDFDWAPDSGSGDSLSRTGADVTAENPFGLGGRLRFSGEFNYRTEDDPDEGDDSDFDFRLNRLSYAFGGDRFSDMRWEIGRFLQNGVAEFGYLDGLEWGHRTRGGDRFGASVGFMPEPDADFETGDDFQVAVHYQWVSDEAERLALGAGFQKTFHDGAADRDLLVARLRYVPLDGWDVFGTAWVDFYGSGDHAKDSAVELTQAILSATRTWDDGDQIDFTYRHIAFPDIEREEFTPVTEEELADNRLDRLAVGGRTWAARDRRLHGEAGVWNDEDGTGGDLEAGLEFRDVVLDYGRADVTAFGTRGDFEALVGARVSFGRAAPAGSWDVSYEITGRREDGFSNDRDDIVQHRVRLDVNLYDVYGCTLSFYGQMNLWDDETAVSSGFYLQRSF